ncbi:MAG: response regulator [Gammaproteobacteria bacterium]|nr:response regulator [Gammaproteobacteria bacterium]
MSQARRAGLFAVVRVAPGRHYLTGALAPRPAPALTALRWHAAMSQKLALIVDDSRSARSVLARMLERHGLDVDTAESAEDAIKYLAKHRPDVIFMDHLMPGMDGLQAVQAIKNDPRTATIPILMYTSQAGDVYLSQARALGAVGVLPKQTRIADVSRALERLHLIEEGTLPTDTRAAAGGAAAFEGGTGLAGAPARLAALPPEVRTVIEALLAEHAVDLRRFVVERLEDNAQRIVGEFRLLMHDVPPPGGTLPVITATPLTAPAGDGVPPSPAPPAPRAPAVRLPWLIATAAAVVALLLAMLWWRGQAGQRQLAAELSAARAAMHAAAAQRTVRATAPAAPAQITPWGVVLVDAVPFGEAAFSGARVERIQSLLDRLLAQGTRASVQITSYPGRFCLGSSAEAPVLANADTPLGKCEQLAGPPESAAPVQHQSLAFANMVAAARRAGGGALEVQLLAGSVNDVAQAYPVPADALTAGPWNRIAAVNNRVEVRIMPVAAIPEATPAPVEVPMVPAAAAPAETLPAAAAPGGIAQDPAVPALWPAAQ